MSLRTVASLLVLCSALAAVQRAGANWSRVARDTCAGFMLDPAEPHVFVKQEDDHCEAEELSDAWEEQIGLSYCKPRTVLVKLNTDPDHEYHPALVEVDRCVGQCSPNSKQCLPTKTSKRKLQVTRTNVAMDQTKCGQVEVTDHMECDCKSR